jgi:RNA polymerase sigma factor (sigma-70 family)
MCHDCPLRRTCVRVCAPVEAGLPSLEAGRVDRGDLERIYQGRIMTQALLDNMDILTARQREVVQLYYRENNQQLEIAEALEISQQAVGDTLARAKTAVGRRLKRFYGFFAP